MVAKPSYSAGPEASTEATGGPSLMTFEGCIIVCPVFRQGVTSARLCPSLHNLPSAHMHQTWSRMDLQEFMQWDPKGLETNVDSILWRGQLKPRRVKWLF